MAEEGIDISHFADPRIRHTGRVLHDLAARSTSVAEVVRRLGINPVGGNHTHIGRRLAALGIDTSHFEPHSRARPRRMPGKPLTLRPRADGRVSGERLRRELLRRGVPELCAMCGTDAKWNNRPLRLEVDHMNGNWWDNRLGNLRLLCPNCHSVTDTYRGRKQRNPA
ncbi:HNH endonuclease [Streptomyces sp. NPDC086010]|uniref:HNH endonuclease n=1 Tax=Streptomyces sp. NPDC086010 TaxID=3365745 RepID=UPI0037D084DC